MEYSCDTLPQHCVTCLLEREQGKAENMDFLIVMVQLRIYVVGILCVS